MSLFLVQIIGSTTRVRIIWRLNAFLARIYDFVALELIGNPSHFKGFRILFIDVYNLERKQLILYRRNGCVIWPPTCSHCVCVFLIYRFFEEYKGVINSFSFLKIIIKIMKKKMII